VRPDRYTGSDLFGRNSRVPGVSVRLPNGSTLLAALDTGSDSGLTLPLSMAQTIPLFAPPAPFGRANMLGSSYPNFKAKIRGEVRAGGLTLIDPDVEFMDGSPVSMVGFSVLRNGVVVLDPAAGHSWLLAPT